jgi:hypothetical protein
MVPELTGDEERSLRDIGVSLEVDRIPQRVPASETERDAFASRDRVRRAAHVAASALVQRIFGTTPGEEFSWHELLDEYSKAVRPVAEQYRDEEKARYIERLTKHQGELTEPPDVADLTCEDP